MTSISGWTNCMSQNLTKEIQYGKVIIVKIVTYHEQFGRVRPRRAVEEIIEAEVGDKQNESSSNSSRPRSNSKERKQREDEDPPTTFLILLQTDLEWISETESSFHDRRHLLVGLDVTQSLEEEPAPRSPKSIRCLAEPRMVRRIRIVAEQTPVRHVLQPPTFATLLAFIVGMVPPIKSVVYGNTAGVKGGESGKG
uniref:Uncharacterized protein LOC104223925 n=1 Tax=Nicotiana sylvestris TaxID=4096 RepID=A0A1U7W977_NICSY|nr:PREDICTED: uncharacterized protein LOC104223925 [Nicotiana sylvestris]